MYASRYFPDRYFAPRYWPKVGEDAAPADPSAFNNATQNWLSPTPHLALLLGAGLALCLWPLTACTGPGKPLEYTQDPPAMATPSLQERLHRALDSLEGCQPWPHCYDPMPPAFSDTLGAP